MHFTWKKAFAKVASYITVWSVARRTDRILDALVALPDSLWHTSSRRRSQMRKGDMVREVKVYARKRDMTETETDRDRQTDGRTYSGGSRQFT